MRAAVITAALLFWETALLGSNLAYLTTFEDEPAGIERSDWGAGPLRLFKTVGGAAYALQVHVSDEPEALAHSRHYIVE
jgi:type IV secretion system protein VirB4